MRRQSLRRNFSNVSVGVSKSQRLVLVRPSHAIIRLACQELCYTPVFGRGVPRCASCESYLYGCPPHTACNGNIADVDSLTWFPVGNRHPLRRGGARCAK